MSATPSQNGLEYGNVIKDLPTRQWLEDVLSRCRDLLVANHLFDVLYMSLFVYDKCPNTVRAIYEYWCPETNSLHTLNGEVFISLPDIHGFLSLSLLDFLYDEVVPPSKELKTTEVHGWNKAYVVFDELGVPKDECVETFLVAFPLLRDVGCIHPGTFIVASSMKRGQAHYLCFTILTSIYRGLSEKTPISAIPIQSVAMTVKAPDEVKLTPKPSAATAYRQKLKFIVKTPISAIPIQSVAMTVKAPDEVKLTPKPSAATAYRRKLKFIVGMSNVQGSKLNYGKVIFPPLDSVENIMDIWDCDPRHTEFIDSKSICTLNDDDDTLYDLTNKRGGDATPLKNDVERLVHQAHNLKDLQESYSDRMITKVRESHCIEVGSKLNEASHRPDAENTRYNALKAKLGVLQEAEWAGIDLKIKINNLNAIDVIDPVTKASIEKSEDYVKESLKDLKTFQ
ncbi:hypothetical protein Cgig2_001894 [Carnegiea gigantea]|uniref:Aminotransferase-like plant mobile domain-containing protein n=1 Tax=Carnegiea gigantea TaxID=171969 RepID=A0A9Q1GXK1_9CARY|nr:hypothetical protein Cgig2_001894 [Carnegiea gigantea]